MKERGSHTTKEFQYPLNADINKAFHQLYEEWHRKVYSYIFTITGLKALAEDATQEVFIKVWRDRDRLAAVQNFEAWLFTIVRHQALNCLRALVNERKLYASLQEIATQKSFAKFQDDAVTAEQKQVISKAIDQLPPQQKTVFTLSYLQGLSRKDIADKLQLSPNTVRNHLNAALISLRSYLQHYYLEGWILVYLWMSE